MPRFWLAFFAMGLVFAMVVASGATLRAADPTPTPSPTPSDTARTDARIRVVFLPFAGDVSDAVRKAGSDGLDLFVWLVNATNPLVFACRQAAPSDSASAAANCDVTRAGVIVSTTLRPAANSDSTLVVQSVDLTGYGVLGTVQKPISSRTDPKAASDDTTTAANLKAAMKQLSTDDVRTLLRTVVVRDGRLSLQPGFQPFIQLIPDVSSSDPTYVAVLQNLLSQRGIASVPSQVNAGTVTSGNASADALCGLGQRYLVYTVAKRTEDRILSLNTRIETRATGHLYDCPTHSDLSFGDTARAFAPNTKISLAPILSLLGSLFVSKSNSWTNAVTTGGLVTAVVDVPPEKMQDHVAEITLQKLVDNFCDRLPDLPTPAPALIAVQNTIPTPIPSPSPSVSASAKPFKHGVLNGEVLQSLSATVTPRGGATGATGGAPAAAGTAAAAGAAQSTVPLDIGNFVSATAPPLVCRPPNARFRNPSPAPVSRGLFSNTP